MISASHIIIASAATKPIINLNPFLIFLVAFASHFVADFIPHWDYKLSILSENKASRQSRIFFYAIIKDFLKIFLDLLIGVLVVFYFIKPTTRHEIFNLSIAMFGGITPDILQILFLVFHIKFLEPLQKFHNKIHWSSEYGKHPIVGIGVQLAIVILSIYFIKV